MQGLKVSDGGTADLSNASESKQIESKQTESQQQTDSQQSERRQTQASTQTPTHERGHGREREREIERRNRRGQVDRRRTPNPVFEARARRVGMTLDRRGDTAGKKSARWANALRDKCANWWRPISMRQAASLTAKSQTTDSQVELNRQEAVSGHGS